MSDKQTFRLPTPCALTFITKDKDGNEVEVTMPKGTPVLVNEGTNCVFYGGYIPDDLKVIEFQDKNKVVSGRMVNSRPHETNTGGTQLFKSSQFLKIRGQNTKEAEGLLKGSRIAVAGFINTDRVQKDKTKDPVYLHNIFVTDLTVLSRATGERRAAASGEAKPEKEARTLAEAVSGIKA